MSDYLDYDNAAKEASSTAVPKEVSSAIESPKSDPLISPRWGTMWLSPRLKANWVVLDYQSKVPKNQAPSATVFIDLPQGIDCVSAIGMKFEQTPLKGGRKRILLRSVIPTGGYASNDAPGLNGGVLYLSTTLKPGTTATGRIWAEWKNGKSAVTEFPIQIIDIPVARQPKEIMAGTAMWPYMINNWPNFYQDYASLGFNQMNLWPCNYDGSGRSAPLDWVVRVADTALKHGIITSLDFSTSWNNELVKKDPDAQALFVDGQHAGPCPSYRGPGFIDQIKKNVALAVETGAYIQSDEEEYGGGNYGLACVCPRCESRWKEWLVINRPELEYLSPKEAIVNRNQRPDHYRAWLWFRAFLTTERYRLYKEELTSQLRH